MTFYNRNIRAELLMNAETVRWGILSITTSASTYTMSSTTPYLVIITGDTAGQKINLPNAQDLTPGHAYYIANDASEKISIYYNDNTTMLEELNSGDRSILFLKNNTTTNGEWTYQRSITGTQSSTSFLSFYNGGAGAGRYLEYVPGISMDLAPYLVVDDGAIVALSLGAESAATGTVGIFLSTDLVNPITTISLNSQISNSVLGLYIKLNSPVELVTQVTSGSIPKPYLTVYITGR